MKLGDTVYLKAVGDNARYDKDVRVVGHKVVKVGRKYFEVSQNEDGRWPIKFNLSDNTQVTEYSANWCLYLSGQDIIDEQEYNKLHNEISDCFDRWKGRKFTLQQLRKIAQIIGEYHE